ncbi:MAG: dacB 2 [Anaerospora sp.]|nr:dacB 2 [Anaerospora sp.]
MVHKIYKLVIVCLFMNLFCPAFILAAAGPPDLTAKSAIVIEASTGKVLYAKNADERRYPASTTKIMTLITALEHGNIEDTITTSANAASTEGSSLWLTPGEKLKMLDMLYGIMLISGNDATVAVAEHISGSVGNFAKLMTEKAHAIGAANTNFVNSSGLPDPNHYSTARDLAKITAYGYKNPLFSQIVGTRHKVIPWPGKDHDRDLYNENKILTLIEGGNGVKTGYTEAAGRCLVSGAKRDNVQIITVVLDSDHMWEDSMALLEYGLKQIKTVTMFNKGDVLKTVQVNNGKSQGVQLIINEDVSIPVSESDREEFKTIIDAPTKIEAPIIPGQKIGKVRILYKEKEFSSVDLVAATQVEKKSLFGFLWGSVWNFFTFVIRNFA